MSDLPGLLRLNGLLRDWLSERGCCVSDDDTPDKLMDRLDDLVLNMLDIAREEHPS